MTRAEADEKLAAALALVHEVTGHARVVMDPHDMRGRWALRDAAVAIGRAQEAVARNRPMVAR